MMKLSRVSAGLALGRGSGSGWMWQARGTTHPPNSTTKPTKKIFSLIGLKRDRNEQWTSLQWKRLSPKYNAHLSDTRLKNLPEFGDLRPQTSGDPRHILRTTLLSLILFYKDFTTGNHSNGKSPKDSYFGGYQDWLFVQGWENYEENRKINFLSCTNIWSARKIATAEAQVWA